MLKFVATPVFATLAVITHAQPSPLCAVIGEWGFLSSMWFMYALMAAAHGGPWLAAARARTLRVGAAADGAAPAAPPAPARLR